MIKLKKPIVPCLWFDQEAEEAVNFYAEVFGNTQITSLSRYGKEGAEQHKKPSGNAMAVSFSMHDQEFLALNGEPCIITVRAFPFSLLAKPRKKRIKYGKRWS